MPTISSSVQTAIISAVLALIFNTNEYLNYVALICVHHCMF